MFNFGEKGTKGVGLDNLLASFSNILVTPEIVCRIICIVLFFKKKKR